VLTNCVSQSRVYLEVLEVPANFDSFAQRNVNVARCFSPQRHRRRSVLTRSSTVQYGPVPGLFVGAFDPSDAKWLSRGLQFRNTGCEKLEDLTLERDVHREAVSSLAFEPLYDVCNRKARCIQLEIQSGQNNIQMRVPDSWDSSNCTRDAAFAATAL